MSTSTVATMLPEGQSDYECFVSDIRNDFELRVETVQKSAEENTKGGSAVKIVNKLTYSSLARK